MPQTLNEFLFEHYKADYEFERERTDAVRDRVTFVVGFLTILGGVLAYLSTNFPHGWHGGRAAWFYLPLALAGLAFTASAAIVLWMIAGFFRYESIPGNEELQKYCDQLGQWAAANNRPAEAVPTLQDSLLAAYRGASVHNFDVNRYRNDRLLLATRFVVVAFLFAGAMLPSYIYEESVKEMEPTLVRLVEPAQVRLIPPPSPVSPHH